MKLLETFLLLPALLFAMSVDTSAQPETAESSGQLPSFIHLTGDSLEPLANAFRLNFAVPDAPAFELLDTTPGNILRPSSVKEFATSFSSFIDENGIAIPKVFAIEFSPGLLLGGNGLTLQRYQKNAWLYRLRLSAGTKRLQGDSGPTQISFGFRTSFIDKADLRQNDELIKGLRDLSRQILKTVSADVAPPPMQGSGVQVVEPSTMSRAKVDSLNQVISNRINTAKARIDERWNNDAFDIAGAVLFAAKDSLGRDVRATELAGWATYAKGISSSGQWLLGLKTGAARDSISSKFEFAGSISTRLYIGSNAYKAFGEVQFETRVGTESLLLNGGGEATIGRGMWFSFTGGVKRDFETKEWNVVSKFTLKASLPFLTGSQ